MNSLAIHARRMAPAVLGLVALAVLPLQAQEDGMLEAMRIELDRSMKVLKTEEVPPYFLSYEITDFQGSAPKPSLEH